MVKQPDQFYNNYFFIMILSSSHCISNNSAPQFNILLVELSVVELLFGMEFFSDLLCVHIHMFFYSEFGICSCLYVSASIYIYVHIHTHTHKLL